MLVCLLHRADRLVRERSASAQSAVAHMSHARIQSATAASTGSPDSRADQAARSQAIATSSGCPSAWAAVCANLQHTA